MEGFSDGPRAAVAADACVDGSRRSSMQVQPIDPHRMGDILELLRPKISPADLNLVLDLFEYLAGNADPARLGDALQPRCDVDPIAIDASFVEDDVPLIDADPKLHLSRGQLRCCALPSSSGRR